MKKLLYPLWALLLAPCGINAQPIVSSLSAASGSPGASITLSGTGFNSTAANNAVYFGATRASVTSASSTSLTVSVPPGATYEPVTVTNLSTGLYGASKYPFLPTFNNPYTPDLHFGSHADYSTDASPVNAPAMIRAADIDGDGKPDLVVGVLDGYLALTLIKVYRNISNGDMNSSSFAVPCSLSATQFIAMELADIDGDGKKDIVLRNVGGISVIRNTYTSGPITSASFASPVTFAATGLDDVDEYRNMAIGDVDGDGKPDIVTSGGNSSASPDMGAIAIFRNTATAGSITTSSFASPVIISTLAYDYFRSITLSDIDGDGKVDLLGSAYGYGGLYVCRNTAVSGTISSSSFGSLVAFMPEAYYINSITTGDLDGDGKQEVVLGHEYGDSVSVLRNTATSGTITSGSLAAPVHFTARGDYGVAIADVTGDAKAEIVCTHYDYPNTVSVLRNTATSGSITTSSFAAAQVFYASNTYTEAWDEACGPPLVADLNNDGRPDIAVTSSAAAFTVIQNQIPGPAISALSATHADPGTSVTLTGSNFGGGAASNIVYFGATRANVTSAGTSSVTVTVPTGVTHAPVSVLNTVTGERAYSSVPFLQTYDHSAYPAGAIGFDGQLDFFPGTTWTGDPIVKDLDGDGKPDVFAYGVFYRNTGTPGTIAPTTFAVSAPTGYTASAFEDIDGDGKPDMISIITHGITIRRNISTTGTLDASSFASPVSLAGYPLSSSTLNNLEIGDIDGDGKPDLVASTVWASNAGFTVLRNSCTPGNIAAANFDLVFVQLGTPAETCQNLSLCDVNNDGLPEVIVVGQSGAYKEIWVFKNNSQAGFVAMQNVGLSTLPHTQYSSFAGTTVGAGTVPVTGDIDGDGKPDLVVTDLDARTLQVLRNTSSGTTISFASGVTFSLPDVGIEDYVYQLAIGDLDGDGKADITVSTNKKISVFRNTATSGTINSSSLAGRLDVTTTNTPAKVYVVDVDGDHRPEVVFGTFWEPSFSILRNNPLAITGTTTVCTGLSTTLSNATTGGTWSSSNTAVATVGSSTGVVAGIGPGTTVITYSFPAGGVTTATVTVNLSPAAISGAAAVCIGSNTTLTNSTPSGLWSSSNSNATIGDQSSGVMYGNTAGTSTITYWVYATGCQATTVATVNPLPATITGSVNVCISGTATLSNTTTGGVWTSSNSAIANVGGATGVVSGIAPGTAVITYTLGTGCFVTKIATVGPTAAIGGSSSVCTGSGLSLTGSASGGTWASSNATVATVGSTGSVSGLSAGTAFISYSVSTTCGLAVATKNITVNATPPATTGTASVCQGQTTTLSDAITGGSWVSFNSSRATVGSATGIVTGVTAGTVTIRYVLIYPGGGCAADKTVTVNAFPAAIGGGSLVDVGSTLTLTDAGTGTWSSSNTSVATVGTSGVVTGVSAGTVIITYTSGCFVTKTVTVNMPPITGLMAISGSGTTTLSNSSPGGAWSTGCSEIATVSAGGVVTGVSNGLATITYTSGGGSTTALITVSMSSSAITGTLSVCAGSTTALGHPVSGGTWSSSDAAVAAVGTDGVVSGVVAGTASITYAYGSGCSSITTVTVNAAPATITGNSAVCVNHTTTLSNAVAGGLWSSSNMAAGTIAAATGVIRGLNAGTTTVSYTLSSGCYSTMLMTVNPNPPLGYSIIPTVCVGSATIFANPISGGFWTSSVPSHATIDSFTGVANGLTTGTTFIAYTILATGCFVALDVNVTPAVTATTGSPAVCTGSTTTLANATSGGTWSSFDTSIATVGSATGVVTGVAPGTAIIRYNRYCNADVIVTVSAAPDAGVISGSTGVLIGASITLGNSVGGGTWSASNSNATVSGSGVVTGVVAGSVIISYSVTNSCSTAVATKLITVGTPVSGITGTLSLCAGTNTTLSNATAGGTWSSGNTAVATIGSTGVVTGVASGTATVTYSTSSGDATAVVTVNPLPNAGAITGPASVMVGASITLSNSIGGGAWSASNSNATVSGGVVTGVSVSSVIISYSVTNSCGTAAATKLITIGTAVTGITGTLSLCAGTTTTLSDATAGGAWISGNTAIATISIDGVVTGVTPGMTTITYSTSGGDVTAVVTVNNTPSVITGTMAICIGGTTSLNNSASGSGTWTSSDATVAAIGSATGYVSGLSAGTAVITYSLGTGCTATTIVTVNDLPGTITGTATVCVGSTTVLSNSATGGTWSSSAATVATVSSTGVVTGIGSGVTNVTYALGTGCRATITVTVNALPAPITGATSVCEGGTTNLGSSTLGGTWSSSDMTIATVGTSGVVSGLLAGAADIAYATAAGCVRIATVTVNSNPIISGSATVCPGGTTLLSSSIAGGAWTGGTAAIATIGTTGLVTGVGTGTANVTYSLGTGCKAMITVTVGPAPATITGTMKACPGTSTALSNTTAGGSWSTSDVTIATADATTGVITGVAAGTVTVTYTTGAGCYRTATVTINPAPAAIAGAAVICAGSSVTLTDVTPGLSWASGNTAVATIGAGTGVVTGVGTGFATITYTAASTNCIATAIMTVNGIPAAIAGPATGCTGSNITLTNSVPGGAWSSSNTATATVDATTGVVTGVASGIVTITYTTGAGCYKTKAITINNSPTVSGYPTVCIGLTTTLSGGGSGTWSSGNPSVATIVTSGGYVTGVAAGTAVMTFTSGTTTCATGYTVTVMPVPAAITGTTTACTGTIVTLGNTTPGGSWSSSNTAGATVGSTTGIVNAVGTGGTVTISYSFGTNCRVTTPFTLKPLPAVIAGSPSVCMPVTTTLTTTTSGGTWTSSNTSVATIGTAISASYGLVTGVSAGTSSITYTITATGCARSTVVTIDAGLNPGTITSSGGFTLHTVSAPTSVTLSSTGAAGGTWSSSNTAVATVNPATGVVTAVAAGSTTITYAVTANCTNIVTRVVNVVASRPGGSGQSSVSSVQLYPNPTSGAFTLVSDEAGTLHLFSIDGKELSNYSISAGINSLSLPKQLAAGVYMCRYTSESGNTTMVRLVYER